MPSTDLLIFTGINVLLAWSVYVVLATGQISLGNAAFMAVGAFTASAITVSFRLPLAVALVVAPLVAALFGVLVAFPALRIRGIYLLMVTLCVGEVTHVFFLNFGP